MTLHKVCSPIRALGADVWNIATEQGATVVYATINGKNCRVIVPRAGQPPIDTAAAGYETHVVTNLAGLEYWLSTIYDAPTPPDADDYDRLSFGPVSLNHA